MKRWQKIVATLVSLVALFAVILLVLLRSTASVPATCAWTMDLAEIRKAAALMPGDKVSEIRVEKLTGFEIPEAVVVTGGPFSKTQMTIYAYQLVLGDQTLVIDSAMTDADAKKMGAPPNDAEAWTRLTHGLSTASAIYVTHEHADHLSGLVSQLTDAHVVQSARLTREQLANTEGMKPLVIPPEIVGALKPVAYDKLLAVAPGVVLIKAPGHTPGSQLVYIQRQDGREVLLTGDTAWHEENIAQVRGPPKLVHMLMRNDDEANVCQLAALHDAQAKNPELRIMPGHDGRKMQALTEDSTFIARFK